MQSGFVKTVCEIGIFIICAQAIVHFRPKASYEKYLKLLVSTMVLIQLFLAVSSIFSADGKAKLAERVEWFTNSLNESMERAAGNAFLTVEELQFQWMGEEPDGSEEIPDIEVRIAPIAPVRVDKISEQIE